MTAPTNNDAALVREAIAKVQVGDHQYLVTVRAALDRLAATAERADKAEREWGREKEWRKELWNKLEAADELEQTLLRWCDERDEGIPVEDIRPLLAATAERTAAPTNNDALADALRRAWGATSVRDRNMLEQVEKRLKRADEVKLVLDEAIDEVTRLKSALLVAQQERDAQTKKLHRCRADYHAKVIALQKKMGEAKATITQLREALTHYANEDHWDETTPPVEVNTAGYLTWEYDGGHDLPWEVARAALAQDAEQLSPEEQALLDHAAEYTRKHGEFEGPYE